MESLDLPLPGRGILGDTVVGKGLGRRRVPKLPGGPIPLGYDGAYEGWCDSWDSLSFPV